MDITTILALVKARRGISSSVKDTIITSIIEGIIRELQEEQGIVLDGANPSHQMFIVDYAAWRYKNPDSEDIPRHLQFRMHNLIIHSGGGAS